MNEIAEKKPTTLQEWNTQQIAVAVKTLEERQVSVPKNFQLRNGLMEALLVIQNAKDSNGKPALQVCKPDSIQKFLLEIATNGLYASKKHYYGIVYGDQLTMIPSYMGECFKVKQNDTTIKNIWAEIVFEGDVFKYNIVNGHKEITVHEQDPDNINPAKIKGAYATAVHYNGETESEYMTIDRIKKSWSMGQAKGQSKAHLLAPDEMAKKTVLRKLAKMLNAINNDSLYYEEQVEEIETEIDSKQNSAYIDVTPDDFDNGVGVDPLCVDGDTDADTTDDGQADEGMVEMDDPFGDLV